MVSNLPSVRPPPPEAQHQIDLHQRWLRTGGLLGVRIGSDDGSVDLSGLNLDGVDLSLGILEGADFTGSTLRGSWFIGAMLPWAIMANCDLREARFDHAELTCTDFVNAICTGASFDQANMHEACWTEEKVERVTRAFFRPENRRAEADGPKADTSDNDEATLLTATREGIEIWRQRKAPAAPKP